MITLTKIFRFESAHAIRSYPGTCAKIHGHSYELHVTVSSNVTGDTFIGGLGIAMDFKDLKKIVQEAVMEDLDHHLLLSRASVDDLNDSLPQGLVVLECEPTAENLLIFIRDKILRNLPGHINLKALRLWETQDSYAEWLAL